MDFVGSHIISVDQFDREAADRRQEKNEVEGDEGGVGIGKQAKGSS